MGRALADPNSRTSAALFLIFSAVALAAAGCTTAGPSASPSAGAPRHLLLITVDTLRADALGAYGRTQAETPWMDRLAAGGVRFDRARAHTVVTLPSHANILSGRLPFEHGVRDNEGFRFPRSMPTLATILKANGYRTAAFVSAFPLDSRFGLDRGFDVYDDGFTGTGTQKAFLVPERAGAETVARARRWLDAQGQAPTFCWVHLYEPHYPYAPPLRVASRFGDRQYDGEVAATDLALRPLLEPVFGANGTQRRKGRTLVVLTSDHGESLGEHQEATHGIFGYEATLRVPLIVYDPAVWRSSVVSSPVAHIDILPTILEALSLPAPAGLPGRNLALLMAGDATAPATTYFEAMSGTLNRGWAPLRGFVRDEVKYVDLPIPEVYDLRADPLEARNLAHDEPRRAATLKSQLDDIAPVALAHTRVPESLETRERLSSLGYVGGTAARKQAFTEADDPKRLVELDAMLQDVVGRYLDGDTPAALERCRELVSRRPEMAISWLHLAHLERENGRLDAGIQALSTAAILNPGDTGTLSLLGAYLTEAGRAREAVNRLKPFAGDDAPDVKLLVSYSLALARLGQTDEAAAALAHAQKLDPSDAMLHVHLGTVRLIANDRAAARRAFEAALSLTPDLARAHSSLGVLAAEDGNVAEATAHWNQAVAVDADEYRTILGMGVNLARRGQAGQARPYLEYFETNAPRSIYATELATVARILGKSE